MPHVDRFRRAEEDLLAIAEYIGRDNPAAAFRWLDQIESKLLMLAKQPFLGEKNGIIQSIHLDRC
jgi:plasmid stabilization system protein ParE